LREGRALNWTTWILLSAVFLALYDLAKKASVQGNAVLPVLLCSTAFGCLAFVAGLAACGGLPAVWATTNARVLTLSAIKTGVVSMSWIFTFCALRSLPITIATPIRASAPALVFLAAFFLFGEIPTLVQAVGMALVFGGYFVFSWAGRHEGIDFLRNRAVWCAFAGMCCSAMSAIWDKYLFQVELLPVETVQFYFQVGLVFAYALILSVQRLLRLPHDRFEFRVTIPFVGILLAAADWLYFRGLAIPDAPISVGSLLRRFSVVITFVLGAKFFHETNLLRKALALAAILVGVTLLCF